MKNRTRHFPFFPPALALTLALTVAAPPARAAFSPLSIAIKGAYNGSNDQLPGKSVSVAGIRASVFSGGHDAMDGLAVAVGANFDNEASGFQIAAAGRNEAESSDFGLFQISIFGNRLGGDGGVFQISLANETEGQVEGLQIGIVNKSAGSFDGLQIGFHNEFKASPGGSFSGLQIGVFNLAYDGFSGLQIGAVNKATGSFHGVQIGAFNLFEGPANDTSIMQLGPFNSADGEDWNAVFLPLIRIAL